jgi:hypothetical protein
MSVELVPRTGNDEGGDWRGHFALAERALSLAYVLPDNGRIACRLGPWPAAPQ